MLPRTKRNTAQTKTNVILKNAYSSKQKNHFPKSLVLGSADHLSSPIILGARWQICVG